MDLTLGMYQSFGNDYLIYDCMKNNYELKAEDIRSICDRRFGVGADGMLVGPTRIYVKQGVRIYNPDGSEAVISGNGLCIFAKYMKDAGYIMKKEFTLQTLSREVQVRYHNEEAKEMTVSMGKLYPGQTEPVRAEGAAAGQKSELVPITYNGETYQGICVWIGNLHCIIPMREVSRESVCRIGAELEQSERFPDGVNTQIIRIADKNNIYTEVYERGVGYTLSSGSSCCAAAGAAYQLGLTEPCVYVHTPGGTMTVRVEEDRTVHMTGSAECIGTVALSDEFLQRHQIRSGGV